MVDILIKNGEVIDGTGKAAFRADIAIEGEKISDVGPMVDAEAGKVIDASGKTVSPGFVEMHTHNDVYMGRENLPALFESFIRQGVTTFITGNCGWGIAPLPVENRELFMETAATMGVTTSRPFEWSTMHEYLDYVDAKGPVANMVHLAPHGPLRIAVMGGQDRFCTPEELDKMSELLTEAMEAGCFGFSSGLMYFPGIYCHTDELVELNNICGRYGGRYSTHLRAQCTTFPEAVKEAIAIARAGDTGLQISHFHSKPFFGKKAPLVYHAIGLIEFINRIIPLPGLPNAALEEGLEIVNKAMEEGLDFGMDMIPYVMANTTLMAVFPPWALVGGTKKLLERLADEKTWAEIRRDMETVVPKWPPWEEEHSWSDNYSKALGWHVIRVLSVQGEKNRHLEGKSIVEIAKLRRTDPWEAARQLTLEENGAVTMLAGFPSRAWIEKLFSALFKHPEMSVMGDAVLPEIGPPPQAAYGTFPRFLGHYVRELKLLSLEEAIRRNTSLAAARYGIKERGEIRKGYFADITVFDKDTIEDVSTPNDPRRFPKGIHAVLINGKLVLDGDNYVADANAGRVLRKS